jgi:protein-disulfide isomerase
MSTGTTRGLTRVDRVAILTLILAVAGGVAVGTSVWTGDVGGAASGQGRLGPAEFAALLESGHGVGDPHAPAVLLVYNDYRCSFCAELDHTLETLRSRYPQHLQVVYKHYVNVAADAGRPFLVPEGVECAAEQDRFEAYHAAAFANARALDYADAPWLIARSAALDSLSFERCISARRHAQTVRDHYDEARDPGVHVTPTLFLNGVRLVGAVPVNALDSLIAGELAR